MSVNLNWVIVPPRGHFLMSADIGCHDLGGGDANGIWWVEARDASKHPAVHRPPQHRVVGPQMSIMLSLRNLVLMFESNYTGLETRRLLSG